MRGRAGARVGWLGLWAGLVAGAGGAEELRTVRLGASRMNPDRGMARSFFGTLAPGGEEVFFKAPAALGRPAGAPGQPLNLEAELLSTRVMQELGILTPRTEVVRIEGRAGLFLMAERIDRSGFLGARRLVPRLAPVDPARVDFDEVRRMQLADLLVGNWDRESRNLRFVEDPARPAGRNLRPVAYDHNVALLTARVTPRGTLQLPLDGTLDGPRGWLARYRPWDSFKILQANAYYTRALSGPGAGEAYGAPLESLARSFPDPVLRRLVDAVPDAAMAGVDPVARRAELVALLGARRDAILGLFARMRAAGPDSEPVRRFTREVPEAVRKALPGDLAAWERAALVETALPGGRLDPEAAYRALRSHGVPAARAARLVGDWARAVGARFDPAAVRAAERAGGPGRERPGDRVAAQAAALRAASGRFAAELGRRLGAAGLRQAAAQAPLFAAVYLFQVVSRTRAGMTLDDALVAAGEATFTPEFLAASGAFVAGATPLDAAALTVRQAAVETGRTVLKAASGALGLAALGVGQIAGGWAASAVTVHGEEARDRAALARAAGADGADPAEVARLLARADRLFGADLGDLLREALHPGRLSATRLLAEAAVVGAVGAALLAATGIGFVALAGAVLAGFAISPVLDAVGAAWADATFDPAAHRAAEQERLGALVARVEAGAAGGLAGLLGSAAELRAEERVLRDRIGAAQLAFQDAYRAMLELAQASAVHALGADGLAAVRDRARPASAEPGTARLGSPGTASHARFVGLDLYHRVHQLGQSGARPAGRETRWPCGYTHRSWLPRLGTELGEALGRVPGAGAPEVGLPAGHFGAFPFAAARLGELGRSWHRAEAALASLLAVLDEAERVDLALAEALPEADREDGETILALAGAVREREAAEALALAAAQRELMEAGLAGPELEAHALRLWDVELARVGAERPAGGLAAALDQEAPAPAALARRAGGCGEGAAASGPGAVGAPVPAAGLGLTPAGAGSGLGAGLLGQ